MNVPDDYANDLRRAAEMCRERNVRLEQAVKWCRGRVTFLEARDDLALVQAGMRQFMRELANEMDQRATDPEAAEITAKDLLTVIAGELRATAAELEPKV